MKKDFLFKWIDNYSKRIRIFLILSLFSLPEIEVVSTPWFIVTTKAPPTIKISTPTTYKPTKEFILTSLSTTSKVILITTQRLLLPPTIDPDFNRCLLINLSSPTLQINSTDNRDGVVIRANCNPPYYINSRINKTSSSDLFRCDGGLWKPVSPRCLIDNTSEGGKVGLIVACVIGIIIALSLILGAIFLYVKMGKHNKIIQQKQEEIQSKMFRINDFVMSSSEDFVGMLIVSVQSRNSDLRGVPLEDFDDEFDMSSIVSSPQPLPDEDTLHLF